MLRVVSGTDYVPIFITLDSIYKCLLSTQYFPYESWERKEWKDVYNMRQQKREKSNTTSKEFYEQQESPCPGSITFTCLEKAQLMGEGGFNLGGY